MSRLLCVAHRGAPALAPENTLTGFGKAIGMGVDAVECDVRLSRDGQVVIMHDATLERTTNGHGRVAEHAFADLRRLDAGSWFSESFREERIPTLEELLILVGERAGVVIEVKDDRGETSEIERKVLDLVRAHKMAERVVIISFEAPVLRRVRALDPDLQTGLLCYQDAETAPRLARDCGAGWLGPLTRLVTPQLMQAATAEGLRVNPWTVDDPQEVARLLALGVQAMTSNHPDMLLRELNRP